MDGGKLAIFALGGNVDREKYALILAETYQCPVYISSGDLTADHPAVLSLLQCGVPCVIDRSAVDTLTNFTTMVPLLRDRYDCVHVITSQNHQRRASAIARVVFGLGAKIRYVVVAVPWVQEGDTSEGIVRIVRDVVRSFIWLLTGWTGSSIALLVHPNRRVLSST